MAFGIGMEPYTPMDREYSMNESREQTPVKEVTDSEVERPIMKISEVGTTVTEGGRFGRLNQSVTSAIRMGASKIELATAMGGGQEPTGAESYGQEARQDLRELARASKIEFTSVHTPSNIGNLSGFNPQDGTFSDAARQAGLDEVNKAINFAAETGGRAVVVHTGEFQRPMFDAKWNNEGKWKDAFASYNEEPERAAILLVDDRTGKPMLQGLTRNQVVYEPEFHRAENPSSGESKIGQYDEKKGANLEKGDYVDVNGNYLDPKDSEDMFNRVPVWDKENTRFKVNGMRYGDYERKAKDYNEKYGTGLSPDELFVRAQIENKVLQSRGHSLFYARGYEDTKKRRDTAMKTLEHFKEIESSTPKEEQWKLLKSTSIVREIGELSPTENKLPSEIIKEVIDGLTNDMKHIHESSASADTQAAEFEDQLKHIKTSEKYAKDKSFTSFAEAGINAMNESKHNKYAKNDIFVAPENIFPEMGYGSHPEELIDLVQRSREKMAHLLTDKFVNNPTGHILTPEEIERHNNQTGLNQGIGEVQKIANPNLSNMGYDEALNKAKNHIKATFDTQHLGMWWKHFKANPGETEDERKKRFDTWYMDEVKKMGEAGIIGHVHAVDSMGSTHTHLAPGQGVMPVVDAVHYLKKMGYDISVVSEGHAEGGDRQLFKAWQAFGNTIYSTERPGAQVRFGDVHQSYFGHHRAPYHVLGPYAPSNDWTLWSETPLE